MSASALIGRDSCFFFLADNTETEFYINTSQDGGSVAGDHRFNQCVNNAVVMRKGRESSSGTRRW